MLLYTKCYRTNLHFVHRGTHHARFSHAYLHAASRVCHVGICIYLSAKKRMLQNRSLIIDKKVKKNANANLKNDALSTYHRSKEINGRRYNSARYGFIINAARYKRRNA